MSQGMFVVRFRAHGLPVQHWNHISYLNLTTFDGSCKAPSVEDDAERKARAQPGLALIADKPGQRDFWDALVDLHANRTWSFSVWLLY